MKSKDEPEMIKAPMGSIHHATEKRVLSEGRDQVNLKNAVLLTGNRV